jgi:nanoRNase/pAp phosphatase (c-di-AMP/oligoRNAs hydrolase)
METLIEAKNLIEKSRNIWILPSKNLEGDVLASSLALFSTLKKIGKNVNALIGKIPDKFRFLEDIRPENSNDFIIAINASNKEVSKMRYEKEDEVLKIYLTLGKGALNANDVSFSYANPRPDLLITIGIDSLDGFVDFFNQNSRLLAETPILNIANSSANESFGEVNLIDPASCLSEITTNLLKFMEEEDEAFLDKNVATSLLTGIICASQNFRNPGTGPKAFETSAYLIERGGDHQKIIHNLYKQKNVSQVNLLGRILEKLNLNEQKELYSALLTEKDFEDCQASAKDLGFVVEELKTNFRYLPNLLILWENNASPKIIKGIFYSDKEELVGNILANFEGVSKGAGALFTIKEDSLETAREKLLKII